MEQEVIRIDLQGVNCYLLKAKDKFILIDTGGHLTVDKDFTNRRECLDKQLEKVGCSVGKLKLIILTHGDNDHTANAAYIRDKYDAKIAMHSADLTLVQNPNVEMAMESFRYRSLAYKIIFTLMKNLIKKICVKTLNDFERFTPDIYVEDGYKLDEYGFDGSIIHTPGHTDGSIGILMLNGDFIAGDTFANMKKPDVAVNAKDFNQLDSSINRLKSLGIKKIYPGHGEPFEASELR
ncbi:MBL fold metallo-hydrolase [Clostridium oryzae]|uniref:Hydroxyacylglutathione hydrolase n=1 Tax=Clostridium oryzae TaxID=1450648 RepID=A0A1V4I667_9CLOT|nr:MBL fold metallo-hydrolase [Clostridium oryzae]OPJ55105.1 hydroxyacylglutathione hydrolase [Clostridium oryzae]